MTAMKFGHCACSADAATTDGAGVLCRRSCRCTASLTEMKTKSARVGEPMAASTSSYRSCPLLASSCVLLPLVQLSIAAAVHCRDAGCSD